MQTDTQQPRAVMLVAISKPARLCRHMAVALATAVAALGAIAPTAIAAPTPGYLASGVFANAGPNFGGAGSGPGEIGAQGSSGSVGRLAIDDATGNILVADPGNGRVEVFAPDLAPGGTATYLTEFAVASPYAVAIDQATHAVYVSDGDASAGRIIKYVSDGAPTPTYTEDPSFVSPTFGIGSCVLAICPVGDFDAPLAVEPTSHDVLVGDRGNNRISRYSATGAFVGTFDGSGTPAGQLRDPLDVSADATSIYVLDAALGGRRVVEFSAAGAYQRVFDAAGAQAIAVASGPRRLLGFSNDGLLVFVDGAVAISNPLGSGSGSALVGIAVDGGASGRAYTSTDSVNRSVGAVGVQVYDRAPAVEADAVTSPDSEAAHLTGTVNPEGLDTTAHFEYSLDGVTWTPTPDILVSSSPFDPADPAEHQDHAIAADVTGLRPASEYRVRVVATDTPTAAVTATSSSAALTTAAGAPIVETGPASEVTAAHATLTGSVTALGVQTTYYFEYGETTGYGERVPTDSAGVAGNSYSPRAVTRSIADLKAGTTYHYRLVAVNVGGTTYGSDQTLTTSGADAETRAYEMVSPVDKDGVSPDATANNGTIAREDGNAILYGTSKLSLPGSGGTPYFPRAFGARLSRSWASRPLDPPTSNLTAGGEMFYTTLAVSKDYSHAVVLSTAELSAGGVSGQENLYLQNLADDSYVTMLSDDGTAGLGALATFSGSFVQVGTSRDARTLAYAPLGGYMYEATVGQGLRIVSRLPDGTPVPVAAAVPSLQDPHQVSDDGSQIVFQTSQGLYLREDGTTTVPLSVSHRPGAVTSAVPADFLGASSDGRYVMFATSGAGDGLTVDAPDGLGGNAYRYDVETDSLTFVGTVLLSSQLTAVAETGNVYFQDFVGHVFRAHDGQVTQIADLAGYIAPAIMHRSPSGRFIGFLSSGRGTSFDNGGKIELYLYDAEADTLTCPSCRGDGGAATGNVQISQTVNGQSDLNRQFARSVLDDGTVIFDTPDPLVAVDTNGVRDVYMVRGNQVTLVSPGKQAVNATFAEATPDGRNVFFITAERLVGKDKDNTPDLYDARVGGGIPEDFPPPDRVPCAGSECEEPTSGPTAAERSATEERAGPPAKPPAQAAKAKISIVRSSVSATTMTLAVRVSSRGRIRVSGAAVKTTTRTATKAGTYTVKVPLSRKTRASRKAGRRVKVAVKASFTPPFVAQTIAKLTRTLGK